MAPDHLINSVEKLLVKFSSVYLHKIEPLYNFLRVHQTTLRTGMYLRAQRKMKFNPIIHFFFSFWVTKKE